MSDILLYNAISMANRNLRMDMGEYTSALEDPSFFNLWPSAIPKLPVVSGTLCVYDNSVNFNAGKCCAWTVPAGTTKVRFELWGAGAGTSPGMCCSGSPFGATGAYASMIIKAVPGCAYTLCAGCANGTQLYCTCSVNVSGCASYVTGYDLCNFCAMGGCSSLYRMMTQFWGGVSNGCCRYQPNPACASSGCLCCDSNALFMCFSNSCQMSCDTNKPRITRTFDSEVTAHGTSSTGTLYKIPSMYAADWFDTNFYGCMCDQPTMLPNGTISNICCVSYTSGYCCGMSWGGACTGNRCQPGKGGAFNHMMGGATGGYGDLGRTGMVKVSWC